MRRPRRLEQAFWSAHSRNWDDILLDDAAAAHVVRLASLVSSSVDPGAVVVDLGCGTGNHSLAMSREGLDVVAVDFSDAMLRRARSKARSGGLHARWVRADLHGRLPFTDDSFDAALSVYAIQFLDPGHVLAEMRRVTRPGATVVIEAPRHDPTKRDVRHLPLRYRTFRRIKNIAASVGERTGLVRGFSLTDLEREVRAAGFEIIDAEETGHSIILRLTWL